jgi:FAD/FMN-containing dehydrogenase
MAGTITNYDGSISTTPRQIVTPRTVQEIQTVLRDTERYPGPVRPKGSYHSLTPCASTDGTLVDMSNMTQVIDVNTANNTFTAQAGLQVIEAARVLREHGRQFMTNIEIGNMTLGSAACCHTKDALDGIEFGQVNSYVTSMKWVTPAGDLAQADASSDPELLRKMRSSFGLCGIVYEVTFRIKPVEALHFTYLPRPIDDLTQSEVDRILDTSEGLICWTVGKTCIFQQRHRVQDASIFGALEAAARRAMWSYGEAHIGHFIDQFAKDKSLRDAAQTLNFDADDLLYSTLHLFGGLTMLAPDKIIDYRNTPQADRYAFTFWAFPSGRWLDVLRDYVQFADAYFRATGFRCNMPVGSYHIRRDTNSFLSYTQDGDIMSIDPIHASTDNNAWHAFLHAFNDFAFERGGTPLLNQSPFVERKHVEAAYGQRWRDFSGWVSTVDPTGRMLNPFFRDLL